MPGVIVDLCCSLQPARNLGGKSALPARIAAGKAGRRRCLHSFTSSRLASRKSCSNKFQTCWEQWQGSALNRSRLRSCARPGVIAGLQRTDRCDIWISLCHMAAVWRHHPATRPISHISGGDSFSRWAGLCSLAPPLSPVAFSCLFLLVERDEAAVLSLQPGAWVGCRMWASLLSPPPTQYSDSAAPACSRWQAELTGPISLHCCSCPVQPPTTEPHIHSHGVTSGSCPGLSFFAAKLQPGGTGGTPLKQPMCL